MKEVNVKVEIHHIPTPLSDKTINPIYLEKNVTPIYRLYVDDDLITERSWIWDTNTFIDENLYINDLLGTSHSIKVECLKFQPKLFELRNLRVNGAVISDQESTTKLSFILE